MHYQRIQNTCCFEAVWGNFVFVGQCYLEDAMHGEAVTWEEEKGETFILS
jgi:hypothetical protein